MSQVCDDERVLFKVIRLVVSGLLDAFAQPDDLWARTVLLLLSFPVLAVGVAGYLASGTGAGPTEAAALAFDPPVPFRWTYSVVQGGGALLGWLWWSRDREDRQLSRSD